MALISINLTGALTMGVAYGLGGFAIPGVLGWAVDPVGASIAGVFLIVVDLGCRLFQETGAPWIDRLLNHDDGGEFMHLPVWAWGWVVLATIFFKHTYPG